MHKQVGTYHKIFTAKSDQNTTQIQCGNNDFKRVYLGKVKYLPYLNSLGYCQQKDSN